MHQKFLDEMVDVSLVSGGCIKFDLKAFDEGIHRALCGVSNQRTLENFKKLAAFAQQRPEPPFLLASTLLVPGYIDEVEVESLAKFVASIDKTIPYSLLAFHPQFYMRDLPTTTKALAIRCMERAKSAGLKFVRIGNVHLLQ